MSAQPPLPPNAPATGSVADTEPKRLRGGLFRHHDFRQLFFGDTISQFGTQLTMLALPVLAIRVLDADAFQMGLLATCEFLAFLVIGLPAGAWVDRWRKQRVLIANDLLRAVALGSLPLAWALDVLTFAQMLVVALVIGCCTVFFDVAYQSYLPDIVESDRIGEGNAKLQASQSVAMIGGPALAGVLIKVLGAPLTILFDAVSFMGSALFIRRIRHVDTPPPREDRRPLHIEIREGLAFVLSHPLLWRITACTSLSNFFSSVSGAMLVLFALRIGLDEGQLGLGFGVGAVGGLLGALVATKVTAWVGEGRVIPLSSLVLMPAAFLMAIAGTVIDPMAAIIGYMLLKSFGVVLYNVTQVSFRQRLCPRPMLGRMNASIRFLVWGVMPIGSFVGGVIGHNYGLRAVFWVEAVGVIVAALPVLVSPLITMRDLPRELDLLSEPAGSRPTPS
ncbi:MAG: MFS transporter [Marmoricola sp.]